MDKRNAYSLPLLKRSEGKGDAQRALNCICQQRWRQGEEVKNVCYINLYYFEVYEEGVVANNMAIFVVAESFECGLLAVEERIGYYS